MNFYGRIFKIAPPSHNPDDITPNTSIIYFQSDANVRVRLKHRDSDTAYYFISKDWDAIHIDFVNELKSLRASFGIF